MEDVPAPKAMQDFEIYLDAAVCVCPGWENASIETCFSEWLQALKAVQQANKTASKIR